MLKDILVPDIGSYSNVDVIEVSVKPGDVIQKESSLITLETDKATLEVPAPFGGIVKEVLVKPGDKVSEGSLILRVEAEEPSPKSGSESKDAAPASGKGSENAAPPRDAAAPSIKSILVPDIGNYSNVDVIEVLVKPGDVIKKESALITLETDKATLEVPAPFGGVVKDVHVKVGDKVSEGSLILSVETSEGEQPSPQPSPASGRGSLEGAPASGKVSPEAAPANGKEKEAVLPSSSAAAQSTATAAPMLSGIIHAGPAVRRFARELGADLSRVKGSGPKNRILKSDVTAYIKTTLTQIQSGAAGSVSGSAVGGLTVAPWPQVDFAKFGEITREPLSRIKKLSGSFLHRNWVMVPHITQFDEADITELEQFRKDQQVLAEAQKVKLTPLVFIMKAVVSALKTFPTFNASLDASGSELILKKYFHIGVAVDTPNGLVVPVVRDVDKKGLFQLAKELGEISVKARNGQLAATDMQGSCFSISSLGGIGGTAFTPIINVPDVAILGVSKSQIKPVYEGKEFKPRLLLPLSLSYDHRVIDGAEAARFITFLSKQLSDIRRLLL